MPLRWEPLPVIAFIAVVLGWFAFCAVFALRPRPPRQPQNSTPPIERGRLGRRDPTSILGIVLQGGSYAILWMSWRPPWRPLVPRRPILDVVATVLTIGLMAASVWIVDRAVRALGKQWSLQARLVEDHTLIMEGPYRFVRHPIYTGMFGMLLATGLAAARWWVIPIGALIFWIGTSIRVRSEEALLRESFPAEYDAYARAVPAIIPRPL